VSCIFNELKYLIAGLVIASLKKIQALEDGFTFEEFQSSSIIKSFIDQSLLHIYKLSNLQRFGFIV